VKIPKEIRNALLLAGILLFSSLTVSGIPTAEDIYRVVVASILVFLVECANSYGLKIPFVVSKTGKIAVKPKVNKGTVFF